MATPTAVLDTARGLPAAWIRSPGWDLFWMFSALWGAAALLTGSLFAEAAAVAALLFLANRLISIGHAWSTSYMVLFSSLLADERRRRPVRFVVVPIALAGLALGLGLTIAAGQRFPSDGRLHPGLWAWALYVLLFWVGHFWHFGNQDFGVLSLYRMRAGQLRPRDREVDKAFTVAMMFVIQPVVYLAIVKTTGFAEVAYTWLPLTPPGMDAAARIGLALAAILTLVVVGFELGKPNRSIPKLLYLLVIFSHPVLLYGAAWTAQKTLAFLYIVAYLWSHWLIAIGLVSRINTNYYQSRGASPRQAVLRHALTVGGIALAVWFVTQPYLDYVLFNTDGFAYKALLAAITPGQTIVLGVAIGAFLAEQLVHYYCDRCLFRFRDEGVRRRVAPLLL